MDDSESAHLVKVIDDLPDDLKQVFVWRYVDKMSRAEVASRLHIAIDRVETLAAAALRECRKRLLKKRRKTWFRIA